MTTTHELEVMPTRGCPVKIEGTWEEAKSWLGYAQKFEQCKLYAQVMLGFSLIELHKKHGIKRGGDRKSNPQPAGLIWEDLVKKELGISEDSAGRYQKAAIACAPRLRKMAGLRGVDLINNPISEMPEPQRLLLADAVKKITDGKTQMEFGIECGIYKDPNSNGGAPKGGPGKRALSLEEKAELFKQASLEHWNRLNQMLASEGIGFTQLSDEDILARQGLFAVLNKVYNAWLKNPPGKRDPHAIEDLLKAELQPILHIEAAH